jgi:hypothetical protein
MVSTLMHPSANSSQRQSRGAELKIHDVDAVTAMLPRLEPVHIGEPAQRCLEGEIRLVGYETIYFTQYQSGRRNGRDFWFQGREAACYEIGIHEVDHPRVFRQITARERRLTGAVWTCNQDASRSSLGLPHGVIVPD